MLQDGVARLIYDFVYEWHMPVFFYISGFLFFRSWETHEPRVVKEKAVRLLIPYLTFSVLYIPLRVFMSGIANSQYNDYWKIIIGVSPNGGVWYLYVLFLFMLISVFLIKDRKILIIATTIATIANIAVHSGIVPSYSVLKYTMAFAVFFLIGLLRHYQNNKTVEKLLNNYIGIKILLFAIVFSIQEYKGLGTISILGSLLGINIVISISKRIRSRLLQQLGKYSMEIYLLHGPILIVLRTILIRTDIANYLISAFMFGFGLIASFLIGKYILHMNQWFELVFLGIKQKKI